MSFTLLLRLVLVVFKMASAKDRPVVAHRAVPSEASLAHPDLATLLAPPVRSPDHAVSLVPFALRTSQSAQSVASAEDSESTTLLPRISSAGNGFLPATPTGDILAASSTAPDNPSPGVSGVCVSKRPSYSTFIDPDAGGYDTT